MLDIHYMGSSGQQTEVFCTFIKNTHNINNIIHKTNIEQLFKNLQCSVEFLSLIYLLKTTFKELVGLHTRVGDDSFQYSGGFSSTFCSWYTMKGQFFAEV